jgi:glycosyltransferase involved in cell wall biosynthesis
VPQDRTTAPGQEAVTTDPHRPLRIVIAADLFPPDINGASVFTQRLAVGLVERGHEVHIVAPAKDRHHGTYTEEHLGVELIVHRLPSVRWPPLEWFRFVWPWRVRAHVAPLLDAIKPDVVHIQSHIVIGRGIVREARLRGIRTVATNHFMPENLAEYYIFPNATLPLAIRIAWADAAKTYRVVDEITAPTEKAAGYLRAAIKDRPVYAISCGIDASRYTPRAGRPARNEIVFVGRVAPEKHLDVLIRALPHVPASLDATLLIVGSGDQLDKLKHLAAELGVEDHVTFTGFATEAVLRESLTNGTVFAMPSEAELQSIASLEAMASGLPIVAADAMALPHLVDGNGYLFRPGDERDLAAKLTAVLSATDDEYLAMKRRSLEMIEAHDINRTLTTFESLYRGESVAVGPGEGR